MKASFALAIAAAGGLGAPAVSAPIYTYDFESAPFTEIVSEPVGDRPTDVEDERLGSPGGISITLAIDEALVPGGTLSGATLSASTGDIDEPLPDYIVDVNANVFFPDLFGASFDIEFDEDREVTSFFFSAFGDPDDFSFSDAGASSVFLYAPFFDDAIVLATDGPSTATLVSVAAIPLPAPAGLLLAGLLPFVALRRRRHP